MFSLYGKIEHRWFNNLVIGGSKENVFLALNLSDAVAATLSKYLLFFHYLCYISSFNFYFIDYTCNCILKHLGA